MSSKSDYNGSNKDNDKDDKDDKDGRQSKQALEPFAVPGKTSALPQAKNLPIKYVVQGVGAERH